MNDHAPIVTLTLNPALDVSSTVPEVSTTHKLRCASPIHEAGGGGINVSRVCQRLGESTLAVAPLGGVVGARVASLLTAQSLPYRAIEIAGETRESVSVFETSSKKQYRFVFPGPTLSRSEVVACRSEVVEAATNSRCLVISGSMPGGAASQLFRAFVLALPGTAVIIDTSGPALSDALRSGAHLVKPSANELSALVGRELSTETEIESAARYLLSDARVDGLVVSLGAAGALVVPVGGASVRIRPPSVEVRSTIGAGDSMVAGLAVGIRRNLGLNDIACLGVAAGTAAVLTKGSELCSPADVDRILPQVSVDEFSVTR